ncbi:MAG: sigma 54-interacting transcriptional regulator [Deltaproteobacteria bacterium]|nr:sigma 54-interacting transcriptional regulator [Deltaproteobacteria bacterium]
MAIDDLKSGTWVTFVGGRATGVRVRRCRLEVVSGPDAGMVKDIEAPVIRIGARRGNDLPLSDAKVSGLHCEIRLDERGYVLRDLDSTNGTFVAGYRLGEIYVPPGTLIALGTSKIRFEPLGESVEIELSNQDRLAGMVGRSVKMRELFARVEKLAATAATVLVSGETGTGKELVAEALHELSARKDGPFVVLDCSSIPENLIESELFGHEKGAFTGATSSYAGAFERASGGTLFLDEIGEMPLALQPKLLRVLEDHKDRRVGGSKVIEVDIRVVAASNRDLGVEVNRGRFREDLFYRLAVARVHVPPLRERKEDVAILIEHFLSILPGAERTQLESDTVELMKKHDWPGNVRELRNVIERAVLLAEKPTSPATLKASRRPKTDTSEARTPPPRTPTPMPNDEERLSLVVDIKTPFKQAKQDLVTEFEKRYISKLLEEHGGNISAAARAAGIDRMSIHKMLNRLGLDNPGRG